MKIAVDIKKISFPPKMSLNLEKMTITPSKNISDLEIGVT